MKEIGINQHQSSQSRLINKEPDLVQEAIEVPLKQSTPPEPIQSNYIPGPGLLPYTPPGLKNFRLS